MTSQHITRCDKEFGAFNGWRFCITRVNQRLVRYFSDIEYGSSQRAQAEAEAFRDHIYTLLEQNPGNEAAILKQLDSAYRNKRTLPATLRRNASSGTAQRRTLTLRITLQLSQAIDHYGNFMGLETSSLIRLAIYHYFTHIAGLSEKPTPQQLQEHLDELEAQAMALGLPSFADLMTNAPSVQPRSEYPTIEDTPLVAAEEYSTDQE